MGVDICIRRGGKGVKGECIGREKARTVVSRDGGGVVHKNEGGVWGVR